MVMEMLIASLILRETAKRLSKRSKSPSAKFGSAFMEGGIMMDPLMLQNIFERPSSSDCRDVDRLLYL